MQPTVAAFSWHPEQTRSESRFGVASASDIETDSPLHARGRPSILLLAVTDETYDVCARAHAQGGRVPMCKNQRTCVDAKKTNTNVVRYANDSRGSTAQRLDNSSA